MSGFSETSESGEDMLSALLLVFFILAIASFCFCVGNLTGCIANWKFKTLARGASDAALKLAPNPGILGVCAVGLNTLTDVELGNKQDEKSRFHGFGNLKGDSHSPKI
jgi:hypothetical protein